MTYKGPMDDIAPHPMGEYRRVPTKRLMLKLGLMDFKNEGPLIDMKIRPKRVNLPLKQHAGAPAIATVKVGDKVKEGDLIAKPAEGAMGARIHASISGVVRAIMNLNVPVLPPLKSGNSMPLSSVKLFAAKV